MFLIFKFGKKANKDPIPNCHILAGNKKNIASLYPLKIENKFKLKEKIIINKIINILKLNFFIVLKTIYKKSGKNT